VASFSIKYIFSMVDQFTGPAGNLGGAAAAMSKQVHSAGSAMGVLASAGSRISGMFASIAAGATSAANAISRYVKSATAAASVPPPKAHGAAGGPGFGGLSLGAGLSYFSGGGKQIFDTNLKFETEFNNARAVMSKSSAEDFAMLRKRVLDLSQNSVFTATQIMKASGELGSAGYEAKEAMAILPQVLQMAQAGREPLDKTAEMLIAIKNQFGIKDDKMQHVNDVLSETARQTQAKLPDLRESFKMAGPFAQMAGVDLETTAALLGMLAQKGIKGSLAGTGLRRMETGFLKDNKQSREFLKLNNIAPSEVYGEDGKMKDLVGTLELLEKKGVKAKDVMKAFGDRAGPVLAALLETGSVAIRKLVEDLKNSDGAAAAMAERQMEGLPGAFNKMKAAIETARISIGDSGFTNDMIRLADYVRGLAKSFTELPTSIQRFVGIAAVAGAALAGLAMPVALLGFAFRTLGGGAIMGLIAALVRLGAAALLTKTGLMALGGIGAAVIIGSALGIELETLSAALAKVGFNVGDVTKQFAELKAAVTDMFSGEFSKMLGLLAGVGAGIKLPPGRPKPSNPSGADGLGFTGYDAPTRDLATQAAIKAAAAATEKNGPFKQFGPRSGPGALPNSFRNAYIPRFLHINPDEQPFSWDGRSFGADAAAAKNGGMGAVAQAMMVHVDPIEVKIPPSVPITVTVTGQINGPVNGTGNGKIDLSAQPGRGTATPEAGAGSGISSP
jgi:TP901 family phage tail tape measure protein